MDERRASAFRFWAMDSPRNADSLRRSLLITGATAFEKAAQMIEDFQVSVLCAVSSQFVMILDASVDIDLLLKSNLYGR